MNNSQLDDVVEYVLQQLTNNVSEEVIDRSLADAGYSDELIDAIFDKVDMRIAALTEQPSAFKQAIQSQDENPPHFIDGLTYWVRNIGLFRGRLSRKQYFVAQIIFWITGIVFVGFFFGAALTSERMATSLERGDSLSINTLTFTLLSLTVTIIQLSILARRFHDINKSAWLSLSMFLPIAGSIIAIYLLFKQGDQSANQYGLSESRLGFFLLLGLTIYRPPQVDTQPLP